MVVLKALGHEPTTTLPGYAVVLESLKNKQIDVFLDHWSPSVDSMVEPYLKENAFEKLNTNFTGAKIHSRGACLCVRAGPARFQASSSRG
jgi:glycine betaine/proline transport system substrate-binding protein